MTDYKYYQPNTQTNINVSFKLLGENNQLISNHIKRACFSAITYEAVSSSVKKIVIYRPKNQIPYKFDIISKWIKDLNEFGFPCEVKRSGENINFILNLENYQYKIHLSSALSLIRCLFESYIAYSVEYYFRILELNPEKDKFIALQEALKELNNNDESSYFNSNHVVIGHNQNEKPMTHDKLFQRFKNSNKDIYSSNMNDGRGNYISIEHTWSVSNTYLDKPKNLN